jgi:DNA-binding LytR/AlgR family response regulator
VRPIKILAVEDDPIYAESLEFVVNELGYELIGIVDNAAATLQAIQLTTPDLILMDIHINDSVNGIELAAKINSNKRIPIIFVTAFKDKETFKKAKLTSPKAYVIKPYEASSLQAAIELAIFNEPVENAVGLQSSSTPDTFYLKDNSRLIKIKLSDIVIVEVDEKYCFIVTTQKKHIVNARLKDILQKLPPDDFVQVHRSYVVRKNAIDEVNVGEQTLKVMDKTIPIGKSYKEQLLATLNYL